jgi:hypothetical protein
MSFLILPLSIGNSDLKSVVQAPLWKPGMIPDFSSTEIIFIFLNLLVLALGVGAAWKAIGMAGTLPLIIFFVYHLANSVARNSGARYLVPVNWCVFLYFALGLVQIGRWVATLVGWKVEPMAISGMPYLAAPGRPAHWVRNTVLLETGLIVVGCSLPLIGLFFPVRYAPDTPGQMVQDLLQRGSLQSVGIDGKQVSDLVTQNGGVILHGRELYPDYIDYNPNATDKYYTLGFNVIGPAAQPVILPTNTLYNSFPDAADVTVVGCSDGVNLWAQAVVVEGTPDKVYLRWPAPTWKCP